MALIQKNILVDSETWARLKTEAIAKNRNIRQFAGEIMVDYFEKGATKEKRDVKAIIIAAGMSSRLMELTDDKPKCMLEIGGKTILQRQIETFNKCGIDNITIIRGYKKEKINYTGVRYVYNQNYRRNNILESLMCAESEMNDEFVCTYSDILFEENIVEELLQSKADISLVTETDWVSHYKDRFQHPIEEAENVVVKKGRIVKIGKSINVNDAYGEFIGLAKFSKKGAEILKTNYRRVREQLGSNSPFHEARTLENAYLTDMFQELIDSGYKVTNVDIKGGWLELDTVEDIHKADKQWEYRIE